MLQEFYKLIISSIENEILTKVEFKNFISSFASQKVIR